MPRPVLLIAGGSRGIGAATAKFAAARGYDVAINYKCNAKAAASVVDEAARALGPLTQFVHSSGIVGDASRLDEATAQTIREVLDIDTYGAMLCLRACMRRMSTKHGGKGGSVVMVSSMAATIGGA